MATPPPDKRAIAPPKKFGHRLWRAVRLLRTHRYRSARFVIAEGETAGAVVKALGVEALAIGAQIDPGVPWTMSLGEPRIALALKSGNFGTPDFFEKALAKGVDHVRAE